MLPALLKTINKNHLENYVERILGNSNLALFSKIEISINHRSSLKRKTLKKTELLLFHYALKYQVSYLKFN